jgi:hypothetical protein
MEPMKPMAPIKPMNSAPAWWPEDLGQPSTNGSQNDMQYAFFADRQRLAINQDGHVTVYDSGHHRISGVSQQQGSIRSLTFTSQTGDVSVSDLKKA